MYASNILEFMPLMRRELWKIHSRYKNRTRDLLPCRHSEIFHVAEYEAHEMHDGEVRHVGNASVCCCQRQYKKTVCSCNQKNGKVQIASARRVPSRSM